MVSSTRLSALTGAFVLGASLLAAGGVATASPQAQVETCLGFEATIVVTEAGVVTFGTPGATGVFDDVIVGTNGPDEIRGLGGDDLICGRGGNDRLFGGPGNDVVLGEGGDDRMWGGDDNDTLNGGPHMQGDSGDGGAGVNSCPATEIVNNC